MVISREGAAIVTALARYRGVVLPSVRRELAGWRRVAALIPDPTLRGHALQALTGKAANPEATGVLASLAPRRSRRTVIRASTALQVAVDYLDSLGEQDGDRLHGDDGGYLERLLSECWEAAGSLPSAAAVLPLAREAMTRCGEGQSHTHAAAGGSTQPLRQWATALAAPPGYEWWEVAAGASSSVGTHALLALAGDPDATRAQAEQVDAAYFPSVGALTVLLDDLVDSGADRTAGEHNYLQYYPSEAVAAERLEAIVGLARRSISPLPRSALHGAILSGVIAFYLSSPGAATAEAKGIRTRLLASSGPAVGSLTWVLERGSR